MAGESNGPPGSPAPHNGLMPTDFIPRDGAVAVRLPDGVYEPVRPPGSVTPLLFAEVLDAFTTLYRQRRRIPLVEEIHTAYKRLPTSVIGEIWLTDEFKNALEMRGIQLKPEDGLTSEMHAALSVLDDPFDTRNIRTKLTAIGIPMATYSLWKKNPVFMAALDHQTKGQYVEALPEIRSKVIGMAAAGNMQAVQMVFDKTGESPKAAQLEDVKQVVMTMVQAIQRHCPPEMRKAILNDVQLTMAALSVAPGELAS